jgi:hypothetical protein
MMFSCVRDGPAAVDWKAAFAQNELSVLSAGVVLARRAAHPGCAVTIFRTIVTTDSVGPGMRWGAFLGLQTQLTAVGRTSEVAKEFGRKRPADLSLEQVNWVYLLVASVGGGFEREAAVIGDSLSATYSQATVPALWHLATWETHRKNLPRVRSIVQVLREKADSSGSRRDRLVRDAISARLTLLEGDSTTALRMLRTLAPSGTRHQLAWQAWESLGPERMELAQLLFSSGRLGEAFGVATELDQTEPVTYPLYQRASLALRLKIADAMQNRTLAADYRRRIAALDRNS